MDENSPCDNNVAVTLTSPSGVLYTLTMPITPKSLAGVAGPIDWGIDDTMWRLEVEPTIATAGSW